MINISLNNMKSLFKPAKQTSVKGLNELTDSANFYLKSSMQALQDASKVMNKDFKVCQKGEDLVLVNTGAKTTPIRLSEIAKEYRPREGKEVQPEDFTGIVLSKIYPNIK